LIAAEQVMLRAEGNDMIRAIWADRTKHWWTGAKRFLGFLFHGLERAFMP
jgi:hypothetical protein